MHPLSVYVRSEACLKEGEIAAYDPGRSYQIKLGGGAEPTYTVA